MRARVSAPVNERDGIAARGGGEREDEEGGATTTGSRLGLGPRVHLGLPAYLRRESRREIVRNEARTERYAASLLPFVV